MSKWISLTQSAYDRGYKEGQNSMRVRAADTVYQYQLEGELDQLSVGSMMTDLA